MCNFLYKLFIGFPGYVWQFLEETEFSYKVLSDYGLWVEIQLSFNGVCTKPCTVPKSLILKLNDLKFQSFKKDCKP